MHSLKGLSGLFGITRMTGLSTRSNPARRAPPLPRRTVARGARSALRHRRGIPPARGGGGTIAVAGGGGGRRCRAAGGRGARRALEQVASKKQAPRRDRRRAATTSTRACCRCSPNTKSIGCARTSSGALALPHPRVVRARDDRQGARGAQRRASSPRRDDHLPPVDGIGRRRQDRARHHPRRGLRFRAVREAVGGLPSTPSEVPRTARTSAVPRRAGARVRTTTTTAAVADDGGAVAGGDFERGHPAPAASASAGRGGVDGRHRCRPRHLGGCASRQPPGGARRAGGAAHRDDPLGRADRARRHPQARSPDEHRRRARDRARAASRRSSTSCKRRPRAAPSSRATSTGVHALVRAPPRRDAERHPRGAHGAARAGLRQARARRPPDLARADKEVNLVITGAETEVDKLIVEELTDPLMHMIRNAIDHGIESRRRACAAGKPAAGTDRAQRLPEGQPRRHRGRGRRRAASTSRRSSSAPSSAARSTRDEARELTPREILNLIFLPGVLDARTWRRALRPRRRHGHREDEHRASSAASSTSQRARHRHADDDHAADHARDHQALVVAAPVALYAMPLNAVLESADRLDRARCAPSRGAR